jgi:hypothetical protein
MTPVRGGGGGGGGGLSPYQYASLVMRQQENEMSAQQKAAQMASQGSSPVDVIGIYNSLTAEDESLDPRVAASLATAQARNMGR